MVKIVTIKMYKTYKFKGQDPVLKDFRAFMTEEKFNPKKISTKSNVSKTTIANWLNGKTKRPQFTTLEAASRAMGYTYKRTKMKINKF